MKNHAGEFDRVKKERGLQFLTEIKNLDGFSRHPSIII